MEGIRIRHGQDKLRLGPRLFAEVVVGGHLVADTHRACVVARVGKGEPVLTQVRAGKGRLRRTTVHNDCDRAVVDVEGYIFGVGQTGGEIHLLQWAAAVRVLGGGGPVVKVLVADKDRCSGFFLLQRNGHHRRRAAAGLCKTQHKDAQLNDQRRNNENGENQPHGFCPGTVLLRPGGLWVGGGRLRGGGRHSTAACALGYGRVGVRHQPLPFQDLAGGLGRVAQFGGGSVLVIGTCGVEVFLIIVQRVAARISWQGRQPLFQLG